MIIRCPSCSTTYKVESSVFDAPRPSFRCSRCKHVFSVHVRLQLDEEASAAGSDPTRATPETGTDAARRTRDAGGERSDRDEAGSDKRGGAPDAARDPVEAEADAVTAPSAETDASHGAHEFDAARRDDDGDDDVAAAAAADESAQAAEPTSAQAAEPPRAPAAGPAAQRREEGDEERKTEEREATDAEPRASELSYPEFEPDPAEGRRRDEPQVLTSEQEDASAAADAQPDRPRPDFEIEDDFLIRPKRETPPPPRTDGKGSVVPLVSLIGIVVFAAGLVTLIHMIKPEPLDNLLKRIPWYGAAVFDSKHYKSTLTFEALASGVRPIRNETEVFVVSGKLINRNDRSIRQVQIEAQLFDAEGKQVGRQATFVGNAISARIIEDMSLREISLLQSLKPQSAYRIPPNGSADFTIVFPKPKAAVASFNCRVLAADRGDA